MRRNGLLVRAAILLLPGTFVLAASCAGESETDSEEDVLDDVPPAKAVLALDGGCTTDGGTDGGGTGGTGGSPPAHWPCSIDDLWVICGVPKEADTQLVYGPVSGGACAETGPVANSSTYCRPKMVLDPSNPDCSDVCNIFRHEVCHVKQTKRMCTKCREAYPGGGLDFNSCVENSTSKCRRTQEAQCYDEGCNSGDAYQCSQQAFFCGLLREYPPSGPGLSCDQFTAGASSCACTNMGTAHCASGNCSSGTCALSGSTCACPSPPPQDGGTDASADAPEGG